MKAVTRKFLMLVAVFSMVMFFVANSYAASQWYLCKVQFIGRSGAGFSVRLTDANGSFTNKMFNIPSQVGNEFLAIGLTAMTSNHYISVYADPDSSVVLKMYLSSTIFK